MNKRIKKKLAKRVNIPKYSDYKIYKGFIHDFTISRVAFTKVYKLPMNKKWIFVKAYKDYYYDEIKAARRSIISDVRVHSKASASHSQS